MSKQIHVATPAERVGGRRAPVHRRPPRVSSVHLKAVMAFTGAVMLGYLVVHMFGNLKRVAGGNGARHQRRSG